MTAEDLYYATYRDGAFDEASADDVFDVAGAVGSEFPPLREDILGRYAEHQARRTASLVGVYDQDVADSAERTFDGMARALDVPRGDVDSAVADAISGRPFAFDRMMADYFGR